MLSALLATQHAPHTPLNGHSSSYNRPSSFVTTSPPLASHTMQGKPVQSSACSSATSAKARPFLSSPNNMFRVYGYTPEEGAAGTSIVVTVQFTFVSTDTTFLRIVVGNRALSTAVRPSASNHECEWDLEAVVPEFEAVASGQFPSSTVPLTVQALNSSNTTLDSLTFGKYTYTRRRGAPSPLLLCKREVDEYGFGSSSSPSLGDLRPSGMPSPSHSFVPRKSSRPPSGGSSARNRAINAPTNQRDLQMARAQPKKQSLIRARRSGSDDDDVDSNYRAVLSIETPTDTMAKVQDWDADERRIGRRLVRFTRVQDGCTLHVVCEAIQPSDYTDGDTVVSCIYRPPDASATVDPPVSQCCITSVDIIFLLECLVGDVFNIEEKNRIRRNLEGFRPKTVSKNKAGTEEFFQKIMDFPSPKPRNIEKDVKVFDWAILPQALDKIISKYTLYPTVKKQEGCATPPSMGTPPHLSHPLFTPYPMSSSPVPDNTPATSSEQSYFYHHHAFSRSQYVAGSLDAMDNNYMTAAPLSSAGGYDSFLTHTHPSSSTPSPRPCSTPLDSPLASSTLSLSYPHSSGEQHQSLYQPSYPTPGAYGPGSVYTHYNAPEFQRLDMAPPTEPQGPQAYM